MKFTKLCQGCTPFQCELLSCDSSMLNIYLTWFVPSLTFSQILASLEKKQQSVINKVCHADLDLLFQNYGILKLVHLPLYIKSKTLLKIKSEAN